MAHLLISDPLCRPIQILARGDHWWYTCLFDPRGRPTVSASSDHCCCTCRPSPLFKTKQISNKNNVRYWRDCGSGRVDHWWQLSCYIFLAACTMSHYIDRLLDKIYKPWRFQRKRLWNGKRITKIKSETSENLWKQQKIGLRTFHPLLFLTIMINFSIFISYIVYFYYFYLFLLLL